MAEKASLEMDAPLSLFLPFIRLTFIGLDRYEKLL